MHLNFSIEYRTAWGEHISVELLAVRRLSMSAPQSFPLATQDGIVWKGDVYLPARDLETFSYTYVVCRGDKVVRREWDVVPRTFSAKEDLSFHFADYWRDIPSLSHLYSTAYTRIVSHASEEPLRLIYFDKTIVFRVQAPQLTDGQALALVGSQPPLGAWVAERGIRMSRAGLCEWVVSVSADSLYLPFEYKYVIVDEKSGELLAWEEGDNRRSPAYGIDARRVVVIFDRELHVKESAWRTAGVVIPVFSMRSATSQGVGDFGDIRLMADWAAQTGMHMIQLLPINDTVQTRTWRDCYPYNSISIFALHPMYVDLSQLPAIDDTTFMESYEKRRAELNDLPSVDYEAVNELKEDYLHRLYAQVHDSIAKEPSYIEFSNRNAEWLVPYSVFCLLRDTYGTCDFRKWNKLSTYSRLEAEEFAASNVVETGYYVFVQYILDKQLSESVSYARSRGVVLKGDIPIGISKCSVEAWAEPYYFNMNGQAGAPPDAFSKNGQNWGFPTYDWERMSEDGYAWWTRRFRKMSEYFDAYRIDHVLGFFRIWEIPNHCVHALLGHFSPSLPMSIPEIEEYGLQFRTEWTQPYITDAIVADIFGIYSSVVGEHFLRRRDDGKYEIREGFRTQRQVEKEMESWNGDGKEIIREGMYTLISNVLFLADDIHEECYHPRISAMDAYVFESLSEQEQNAFRQLHEHYYYHRHNDFWHEAAMRKLPSLLQSTRMLVCAEDLGMVPSCVGSCLDSLKVLTLEIESMPKTMGSMFADLQDNPYRSVCTIFTHDMPTLRGWWEEDYGRSQRYFNQVLRHEGIAPQTMTGALCKEVVKRHLDSPSMLCLISLQDWLGIDEEVRYSHPADERINIPSNPSHYWRYRMHLYIEQLIADERLSSVINTLVSGSGRR